MGQIVGCKSTKKTMKRSQTIATTHTTIKVEEPKEIKNILIPYKTSSPEDTYQILNIIFSDSNQTVWKVKHKKVGLLRAMIKKEKKDQYTTKYIENLINTVQLLDHPGVIKIFEVYDSPNCYTIITELTDGRSLLDEINDIGPFQEKIAANIIFQLLSIVNYLHNTKHQIHGRINPNNISLNSFSDESDYYDIKLLHFEHSFQNPEYTPCSLSPLKIRQKNKLLYDIFNKHFTQCTPMERNFFPPEILNANIKRTNVISDKIDMWDIGLIAFFLFTGKIPNAYTFKSSDLSLPIFDRISPHGKRLISLLLNRNPSKRISAKNAIKSKWFGFLETKKTIAKVIKKQYKKIMSNIKRFKSTNKLFQTSLAYLVHNIPDIEDVRNINKMYMSLNSNCDGKMTKEDIKEGFDSTFLSNKNMNKKVLEKTINDFFGLIDNDGNGYIEYEEFARAGIDKKIFTEREVLQFSFDFFDKEQKGVITFNDIDFIFSSNEKEKEDEIKVIKRDLNININSTVIGNSGVYNNEEITFELYQSMMKRFLL